MTTFRRHGMSVSGVRATYFLLLALVTTAAIGCFFPTYDVSGGGEGGTGSPSGGGFPLTLVSQTTSSSSGGVGFLATPDSRSTVFATVSSNEPGSRPAITIHGVNGSGPYSSFPASTNSASVSFTPTESSYTLTYSEGGTPGTTYTIKVFEQ
ncbi:MAG: hypothetical protein HY287_15950 [Planctomycetes bacterium]|nr:hypothetical protein [Planctomycetota bacterium]